MYPKLSEIRNLERDTLKAIIEIGAFAKLGEMQNAASAAYKRYNSYNGPIDVHLGFSLDIRLRGDRASKLIPRRVDVGALVLADASNKLVANASYSLVICKEVDPATSAVVRKLHFDYEPISNRNASEPKPSVHMQVCGKLSPHHIAVGYLEHRLSALYPKFEKPRIPLPPTSIALIINWLLLEFQSGSAAQPILKDDRWRKLVSGAERIVLTPYFRDGSDYLSAAKNVGKRFLQSYLYEIAD